MKGRYIHEHETWR